MENEQNNGRPADAVRSATARLHARLGFDPDVAVLLTAIDNAEADTALLRQALQKVADHEEGPGYTCEIGEGTMGCDECDDMKRVASAALSATKAGQSLLDRIHSLEEQVQRLTPTADEVKAMTTAGTLAGNESFDEEADVIAAYLKRVAPPDNLNENSPASERKYPDGARVKVIKLNPFDDGLFDWALNQPGTVLVYRQHPMMLKPHMVYEVKLDCHPVSMLYTEDYLGPADEKTHR